MSPGAWSQRPWAWALAALVALVACVPSAVTTLTGDLGLPPFDPALSRPGGFASEVTAGRLTSRFGCAVASEVHEPTDWRGDTTVLLAHGFLRDLRSMRGWAEHWASHGVRTAVAGFCNSAPFDGRHDRNALDLRAVADAVVPDGSPLLYTGFSAGGLAALLAAAGDPRAAAYLGLDAVDSGGLAAGGGPSAGGEPTGAVGLGVPALFLAAEPGSCNAQGNMLPTAASIADASIVRIPNATHCHFEDPYDLLCETLCGRVEPAAAEDAIRAAIRAVATAWALDHAGRR